jgi:hypothetical protein
VRPAPRQSAPVTRAVPRIAPRPDPRVDRNWSSRPPVFIAPRYPTRVQRPYYAFRPRVQLSFGLFVGYPFRYPTWYDDPFGRNSYYYGSPYSHYRSSYGGLAFDIQPWDTEIYVDGDFVGTAGEFGPFDAPLTVWSGVHRIELHARGCQPISFTLTVLAGQVIPYRGSLPCGVYR